MSLAVLSPREASMFACLTDTIVAPEPGLPPVRETDAVVALDRWLAAAPAFNRLGLRVVIVAGEIAPLAFGFRRRLRALPKRERAAALERAERVRAAPARALVKLVKGLATFCYYGDDGVMRGLGYDAGAVVARGRALRAAEGRP